MRFLHGDRQITKEEFRRLVFDKQAEILEDNSLPDGVAEALATLEVKNPDLFKK